MGRYPRCERCRDEHTNKCATCNPDIQQGLEIVTVDDAIEFFIEENEGLKNTAGERVKLTKEYRINQMAIEALKEKINK
jgi:hypothetical protein